MADNRITKHRLKNHWTYSWWKYLLMAVLVVCGVNIVFSMTAYRAPEHRKLEIFLCNGWADAMKMQEELWPAVQEMAPDQEEMIVMNIDLTSNDAYTRMQYSTYMAAQQGDLLLIPKSEMKQLAGDEAWVAFVELTPYIESGLLDVKDIDLTSGMYRDEYGEKKLYGIPADTLYGLTPYGIDPADSMMVVTAFSGNEENVVRLMDLFIERFSTEKPDFYDEWHQQRRKAAGSSSQIFN